MTPEKVKEVYNDFIAECPNGLMTKKKFIQMHEKLNQKGDPEKFCKLAFKAFDSDGNGKIDFNEFCVVLATSGNELDLKKSLESAFAIYDSNSDGKISKKEMEKAVEAILELKGNTDYDEEDVEDIVDEIFTSHDKNNDNYINLNEFLEAFLNSQKNQMFLLSEFKKPK